MSDTPRRYVLVSSDRYDADRENHVLFLNRRLGPVYAGKWYDDLLLTVNSLTGFPGPLSHARDEDASDQYGREVRRLLYHGPARRRTGTPVRVLFTLLPPTKDDPGGETVILLLRLLHGAQVLSAPDEAP